MIATHPSFQEPLSFDVHLEEDVRLEEDENVERAICRIKERLIHWKKKQLLSEGGAPSS
jgi:hypothetical protein